MYVKIESYFEDEMKTANMQINDGDGEGHVTAM